MMTADFDRPFPNVRHVAIRARNPATAMNPLIPYLKLRVLGFQQTRAVGGMRPVLPPDTVIVLFDLLNLQTVVPRIGQILAVAFEIVFHVTLTADESPHFLTRGQLVRIVVGCPIAFAPGSNTRKVFSVIIAARENRDSVEKTGAGDP